MQFCKHIYLFDTKKSELAKEDPWELDEYERRRQEQYKQLVARYNRNIFNKSDGIFSRKDGLITLVLET
ncbi:unnamed protein product [Gongylonema pulchrum]|uniref:Pepsin-I3 domain-containing protein n=1 Tax=Gongylonema pulchrum TaxID=637853 RepID=A0A183EXW1_9BILA|nr:unnamed protein product [Gongylonema pulchrum]